MYRSNPILRLASCFVLLFLTLPLGAQKFQWVRIAGSTQLETIESMAVDDAGNQYVSGRFSAPFTLDAQTFSPQNGENAFLARFDKDGKLDWFKSVPVDSGGESWAGPVAVGPGGRIYWNVSLRNGVRGYFGQDTLNPVRSSDMFLLRIDSSGNLSWKLQIEYNGPTGGVTALDIAPNGKPTIGGKYYSQLKLPNGLQISTRRPESFFILQFDANGTFQWWQNGGCNTVNFFKWPILSDLSCAPNGDVLFTGYLYPDSPVVQTTSLSPFGGNYVARLNPQGKVKWVRNHQVVIGQNRGYLETDAAGNAYVFNQFTGQIDLDSIRLSSGNQTTSSTAYLAKYDTAGNVDWALNAGTSSPAALALSEDSLLTMVSSLYDSLSIGGFTFYNQGTQNIIDPVFSQVTTNGVLRWANQVEDGFGNSGTALSLDDDRNGNLYFAKSYGNNGFISSVRYDSIVLVPIGMHDLLWGKLTNQYNTLLSGAFLDVNNNGIRDSSEQGMRNIQLHLQPWNLSQWTRPSGNSIFVTDSGSYTLTVPNPPKYHTVQPASHQVNFNAYYQTRGPFEFGLHPLPNVKDLSVLLTDMTRFRPGRAGRIQVNYANAGTVNMNNVQIQVVHDSKLSYTQSSRNPASQSGDTLNFGPLALHPQDQHSFWIDFIPDTSLVAGNSVKVEATIVPLAGDTFPADNYSGIEPVLTTAYDPNDKQVSPVGPLTQIQFDNTEWLSYLIRFQNTGNDTAFLVRLRDTLTNKLIWNTFEMQAASHPYTLSMRGNRLEWVFDNILLPDSFTNESASRGFVQFRIKPDPNLVSRDFITNKAAIYFDYNAPVITNTAWLGIDTILAVNSNQPDVKLELLVYPNPVRTSLFLKGELKKTGPVEVHLMDLNGRVLRSYHWDATPGPFLRRLELADIPEGVYLLDFRQGAFYGSKKILLSRK